MDEAVADIVGTSAEDALPLGLAPGRGRTDLVDPAQFGSNPATPCRRGRFLNLKKNAVSGPCFRRAGGKYQAGPPRGPRSEARAKRPALCRVVRLFAVEDVIKAYKSFCAKGRGEVEAEVISAVPLTDAQTQDLTDTLRQKLGKTPRLIAMVDPKLLGGLIIRVGSQMIDTSLRTKLKNLEKVMKEAS